MELDLGLASSFLVLAEEGHYGRAAARLHVTSPALTKRIQRLERQLGVVVLQRGSAGARPSLAAMGLARITRDLHRSYPEAHFTCHDILFSDLNGSLDDKTVDVLWTSAPVSSAAVDSRPLKVNTELVGLVGARHRWADAGSVDVGAFCGEPMLYNPAVSEQWMGSFWLADIRPRRDARLVEFPASDHQHVLMGVGGDRVTTTVASAGPPPGSGLRIVTLAGAARMNFYAARRRTDRRGAVLGLVEAFEAVPANALANRAS
jgi:DNA-binding transcriptional LysR family regulator